MKRTIDRKVIDWWVLTNRPGGLKKLSKIAGVSQSYISKIRTGHIQFQSIKPITLRALLDALQVEESELYPIKPGKSRAS